MAILVVALFMMQIALQVMDVITTNKILMKGGTELNPIVAWFMDKLGVNWWLIKVVLMVVLGIALYNTPNHIAVIMLAMLNTLYVCVVWHNYNQHQRY